MKSSPPLWPMSAFSYENSNSFLLDAVTSSFCLLQEEDIVSSFPSYNHHPCDSAATTAHERSSSLECSSGLVTSSSPGQRIEVVVAAKKPSPPEKKRKERQRCVSRSTESYDAKEAGKSKKQRKCSDEAKGAAGEKKAPLKPEPPSGYIHVRARRGQATDSHSLAERVRRERISERMKMLQGLVPGCDKVTGKAFMLDEIINYVQSLKNQVEFLSMKLASAHPSVYDFGFSLDDHMFQPEKLEAMLPPLPSVQQTNHIDTTAFTDTSSNYPLMDCSSVPFPLQEQQGPSDAFSQDSGSSFVMHVGHHGRVFPNQFEFNIDRNMCSFQ